MARVIMSLGWIRRILRRDDGTVTPLILIMAVGILIVIGMAYDGGGQYDDTQRADFLAQEAARTGAQNIDLAKYMTTGQAAMDETKATAAVKAYLGGVKDLTIDLNNIQVIFGAQDSEIQVIFTVVRSPVFLTGSGWGIDKAYGDAVVVLKQGVTDAGG
jgi:hypothetical protein